MRERVITYKSSNGEHDISAVVWENGGAKAVLQISHGMCEFTGRYKDFAKYLVDKGFVVCANDHAGHGKSVKEDAFGYMGAKDGYRHMVNDVRTLFSIVKGEYKELPYFLLGHSMGSFIARSYCTKYGGELDGIIYSGTGESPDVVDFAIALCRLMIRLRGAKTPGKFLAKMSDNMYNKRFKPNRSSGDWLSRDIEMVDAFVNRPDKFIFTYGGYLDLFLLLKDISSKDWAGSVPKDLPCLMFSGSEDPVGDYGKGVEKIHTALKDAGLADLTLKLYEGGRHEMLNETNRAEVYEDVYEWLTRVINQKSKGIVK